MSVGLVDLQSFAEGLNSNGFAEIVARFDHGHSKISQAKIILREGVHFRVIGFGKVALNGLLVCLDGVSEIVATTVGVFLITRA